MAGSSSLNGQIERNDAGHQRQIKASQIPLQSLS
jgi:hypothetical protein